MFLISVGNGISFWLIFRLAWPWLLIWVWSEFQIFACLELKFVFNFNVIYKLFQKLCYSSDIKETLVDIVVVSPKTWESFIQEFSSFITCEFEMGCNYFFCNLVSIFFFKDELSTWIASFISIFDSIGFDETSH